MPIYDVYIVNYLGLIVNIAIMCYIYSMLDKIFYLPGVGVKVAL